MNYFYQQPDGSEVGPVEQSALEEYAANGTISRGTPVRSALLKRYKTAGEMAFLTDALAAAEAAAGNAASKKGGPVVIPPPKPSFARRAAPPEPAVPESGKKMESTALEREFDPDFTTARRRLAVFLTDLLVLVLLGTGLFALTGWFADSSRVEVVKVEAQSGASDAPRGKKLKKSADGKKSAGRENAVPAPRKKRLSREEAEAILKEKNEKKKQTASNEGVSRRVAFKVAPKLRDVQTANDRHQQEVAQASGATGAAYGSRRAAVERAAQARAEQEARLKNQKPLFDKSMLPDVKVAPVTWRGVAREEQSVVLTLDARTRRVFPADELKVRARITAAAWLVLALLYYGVSLGCFAQTFGMWFWGALVVRRDLEEAGFFRVFCFIPAALLLSPLMIPFVYFFDWAPADRLCGVRVVNLRARPKD